MNDIALLAARGLVDPTRATVWSNGVQVAGPGMPDDIAPETSHDYDAHPPSFGGRPKAVISRAWLDYLCRRFEAAEAAHEALPRKRPGVNFGPDEVQRRGRVKDARKSARKAFTDALKMTNRRRFGRWALSHANDLIPALPADGAA